MSGWEPSVDPSWGGRPIARRIADVNARQRVVVTGSVVTAKTGTWGNEPCRLYQLDDGTGLLTLAFTGSRAVPGVIEGARCTVEGTALDDGSGVVLWNPFYRFEP